MTEKNKDGKKDNKKKPQFYDRKLQMLILLFRAEMRGKMLDSKQFQRQLGLSRYHVNNLTRDLREKKWIRKFKVDRNNPERRRMKFKYQISPRGKLILWQYMKGFPISIRTLNNEKYMKWLIEDIMITYKDDEEGASEALLVLMRACLRGSYNNLIEDASIYRDLDQFISEKPEKQENNCSQ